MSTSSPNRATRPEQSAMQRSGSAATRTDDGGGGRKRWYAGGAIAVAAIVLALIVATGGTGRSKPRRPAGPGRSSCSTGQRQPGDVPRQAAGGELLRLVVHPVPG